jgi:MFS transporter, ACS family, tartrate transporter
MNSPQLSGVSELAHRTIKKVSWRLLPFLFILYVFNYIDRLNVGAAALTMKTDLGYSDGVYAFGAGVFFLGYFLFEVPSNLIMEKVGARLWIARIMITWGAISAAMMFAKTPAIFYTLRFLLGVAEAGFFPGIILYFTYWFPREVRARAVSRFVIATMFSSLIGNPLAAQLLKLDGIYGLRGWQWMFLLEGLPSVALGFMVFFYLTDKPEHARWLTDEERSWLVTKMETERSEANAKHHMTFLEAVKSPLILQIAALFLLLQICGYGMNFFQNLILRSRSTWTDSDILYAMTIPPVFSILAMLLSGWVSDKTRQRRPYVALGLGMMAVFSVAAAFVQSPVVTVICFVFIIAGQGTFNSPFWTMITEVLSGSATAGGIAFVNSIGNLGGFIGPMIIGQLRERSTGYTSSMLFLSGCAFVAMILTLTLPKPKPTPKLDTSDSVAPV